MRFGWATAFRAVMPVTANVCTMAGAHLRSERRLTNCYEAIPALQESLSGTTFITYEQSASDRALIS